MDKREILKKMLEESGDSNVEIMAQEDPNDDSSGDYIPDLIYIIRRDNLDSILFDSEAFSSGVNNLSYLCGQISALVNVGITPSEALNYLSSKEGMDKAIAHEERVGEMQSKTAIECSKFEGINAQKNMI